MYDLHPYYLTKLRFSNPIVFSFSRLVAYLDKVTLRLLAENERVASFSPDLRDRLTNAQDKSTAKVICLSSITIKTY